MRNILTKYTTRAGLCAMALVLAAALVLAGCKQEAEPSRQETQLEKDIKALAGKGTGIHEVKADKTLTNADMEHIKEALQSLPGTVKVNLNLSSATEITSIGFLAFNNCTALASVSIPESVTSIERNAFSGCTSLTSFTIPASVTSIGESAFEGCSALKEITIPASVTSIGWKAFEGCSSLERFMVEERNEHFSTDQTGRMLLSKDGTTLLSWPSASGDISIPAGVTSIEEIYQGYWI